MDAAPKLAMLGFCFKTSPEPAHFAQKLKQYISEWYHEDGESYRNELHQLEGLRATASHPAPDAAGLAALYRYFCQLRTLQSRFPMCKGQLAAVQFTWRDIYANMSHTVPDIIFEMASVLYNIGAVHTHLGSTEVRTTSDGLKAACTHYQKAAWAFQHLREQYTQPEGTDISPEMVRVLQELCLAMAQECILEKSIADARKATTIGAVAVQVVFHYRNAATYLNNQNSSISAFEIMGTKSATALQRFIQFKSAYIGSVAYLYHGIHAEEQQKMGERVAFYQLAVDRLEEARKLAKYIEPKEVTLESINFTNDIVEGKRKAAKNENEFIYHEEVPEKDLLPTMKPAALVKEIAIDFNDPEISGTDLFARLVPIGAHEDASLYSEEKAKLLRRIVTMAETKDQQLTEFMSSLQLDLLDAAEAKQSIPEEVVERCAAMNADSSIIQSLMDSMNSLAEIISDVEHALDDVKKMIQEETDAEKEFQSTMGARPPSIVQTELAREANKYCEAHARTSESNQVLHKAMMLHLTNLKLLASPLETLQEKIPSVAKIEGLDTATLAEMKKVTGAVRDMQRQRTELIQKLRDDINSDDITATLLARASEQTEDIIMEELQKYDPKIKIIELNLAAQENIVNRLTSVYASYGESRRLLVDVLRRREAFINALVTSYDTRAELLAKAQKGLQFYRKLSGNVSQLLARLRSTCQVQREERASLMAKHSTESSKVPATLTVEPRVANVPESSAPKLKDYLPYMKNRTAARNAPIVQAEKLSADQMYPESLYPTSARPAPLGSEANTEPTQTYMDGYAGPSQNTAHNIYSPKPSYADSNLYGPQNVPAYSQYINNPQSSTSYDYQQPQASDSNSYAYGTNYTPAQYPVQSTSTAQDYYAPYYTGSQDANTSVTNSQTPQLGAEDKQNPIQVNANQNPIQGTSNQNPGVYYMTQQVFPNQSYPPQPQYPIAETPPHSSVSSYGIDTVSSTSQTELNSNFSQMYISGNVTPSYQGDPSYSQTYFSAYYLQNTAPNVATYSSAAQPTLTSMSQSQNQIDYNSLNYPYSATNSVGTIAPIYLSSHQDVSTGGIPVSYDTSSPALQQYSHVHNIPENNIKPVPSVVNPSVPSFIEPVGMQSHTAQANSTPNLFPLEEKIVSSAALSKIPIVDQPIKSHVTGQALTSDTNVMQQMYHQNYPGAADLNASVSSYSHQSNDQIQQPVSSYPNVHSEPQLEINSGNYPQSFQNHPGYFYNTNTGNYEYNYGCQISNSVNSELGDAQSAVTNQTNIYTSAGSYETVQSPSIKTEQPTFPATQNIDQSYYNSPYGYQSNVSANANTQVVSATEQSNTNYGADTNQSTYMSSGKTCEPISTYSSQDRPKSSTSPDGIEATPQKTETNKTEKSPEQSTMDLLSGLDFSVDQQPLMPEIKVPPVSEHVIRKPAIQASIENITEKEQKLEGPIERPAKRDIFSDPSLLNKFTQEVKVLQKLVDSLTNKMQSGITVLDNKWKMLHDAQAKENSGRSKSAALEYSGGNIVSEVVPFDDSRVMLKVNPEVYLNASYYKQLAPWCIPLVISKLPEESEQNVYWTAVFENNIACMVCLLSEMELQGKCYWPTAKGQSLELDNDLKVTLDEVITTVHWTERRLIVSKRKTKHSLTHYQINVFPNKVVSGPLVLLVDKLLDATYSGRLSNQLLPAWIHCEAGAGRSGLLALLTVLVCQVRAGQVNLCEMMDSACLNLYKGRTNVLEDTKFLADAYRTALFYVQGVLCSGSTKFNGEAISVASSASVQPPLLSAAPKDKAPKFSKESFEEMKQTAGLKTGDMKDPLSFLDPLWSLKKK